MYQLIEWYMDNCVIRSIVIFYTIIPMYPNVFVSDLILLYAKKLTLNELNQSKMYYYF